MPYNTPMPEKVIEEKIGELLRRRGWKLAVAESCTGGLVGHRLTNIAGSSDYFLGSIVAYAYEVKVKLLGVSWETMERYGAVSRETVMEMARGVRLRLGAEIGMAVSGIAGPGGGMAEKPVGLTWIGLSTAESEHAWSYVWDSDRIRNKERSAEQVLQHLWVYLEENSTA